jgi:hypothetical protein
MLVEVGSALGANVGVKLGKVEGELEETPDGLLG